MSGGPSFPAARIDHLADVMAYVDDECGRAGVPDDAAFAVRLAVEEAFTNIVRHGYADEPGPVRCELRITDDRLAVTLVDEAPTFDPADSPTPDVDAALDDRLEGGLGWHLVRQVMDEVRHEPGPAGGNVLTMIKRLNETTS